MSAEANGGGLRLGVLDQSPVAEGMSGADALRNTVDLACLADRLGYSRYWVAEHHGGPLLAGPSPEALIGPVASATRRVRVGAGGVMLPHYSPLKVAETFSVLAALFPGRIDLGIGRAAGSDPLTAFALQRDRREGAPDDFPHQLAELIAYLRDEMPEEHPFARLSALPGRPEEPELWLLGSSVQSAIWAAEVGAPYAIADFINAGAAPLADEYRRRFTPSSRLAAPRVIVAVSAIAADTGEEAERLGSSVTVAMRMLRRGTPVPLPPVDAALRALADDAARRPAGGTPRRRTPRRMITGAPAAAAAGIRTVAEEYGADEVLVVTITHDHSARRRSYELLAGALGLSSDPRPAASPTPA